MTFEERKPLYEQIERERGTKIVSYITSDRPNADGHIGADCIDIIVDALDAIGPTSRISLLLHTTGGNTAVAWRLVNLFKIFCDEFEVLIPNKAMSAGTLISLGAQKIVMSKQATLGPIDPSLTHPLGPSMQEGNPTARVPVSVEAVRGYLDAATQDLGIKDDKVLGDVLMKLSDKVHPLVLGEIFRTKTQIRFLAEKLLKEHVQDAEKVQAIVDFLCSDSGSHDYTINRREAEALGLPVEKPSDDFYKTLKTLHQSYSDQMQLTEPFNPVALVASKQTAHYQIIRAMIESVDKGSLGFMTEGDIIPITQNTPLGPQEGIQEKRTFDGWREV